MLVWFVHGEVSMNWTVFFDVGPIRLSLASVASGLSCLVLAGRGGSARFVSDSVE